MVFLQSNKTVTKTEFKVNKMLNFKKGLNHVFSDI